MRKLCAAFLTSAFALFLAFAFTPSAYPARARENCSCHAPDNSCSASITCRGGCHAICDPNGDCVAYCSGYYGFLGTEFSLQMENGTYPQLVTELARVSGQDFAFSPSKPGAVFNLDAKRTVMWDFLVTLSNRGTVRIGGMDFEKFKKLRSNLRSGKKVSLCVRQTNVSTFVSDTASLTGLRLRVTGGSPMATVDVQLQDVTLDEILAAVSEQTGTTIAVVDHGEAWQ